VLSGAVARTDPGAAQRLHAAALLEVVLALACVATALALFPVLRRTEESLALGFVVSRTLEAGVILVGVVAMLAFATVAPSAAGSPVPDVLVAVHDWAFLLGPGLIPGVNALVLGFLLHRSRLVPRVIPLIGLVGGPLLLLSAVGTLFGVVSQVSAVGGLAALPVAVWEISLGCWLAVKGIRPVAGPVDDRHPGSARAAQPVG